MCTHYSCGVLNLPESREFVQPAYLGAVCVREQSCGHRFLELEFTAMATDFSKQIRNICGFLGGQNVIF